MYNIGLKPLHLPLISTHENKGSTAFPKSKPIHRTWQMRPPIYPLANEALKRDYYKDHILKRSTRPTAAPTGKRCTNSTKSKPATTYTSTCAHEETTKVHERPASGIQGKLAPLNKMINISGSCILNRTW